MSIGGYLIVARVALIAAMLTTVVTGILCWKLELGKACSMLYGLPMKKCRPLRSKRQPDRKTEALPQSTVKEPKTELLNRYETVCLYEQTFIHTQSVIE